MATLALSVVGSVVGGAIGGPFGAALGRGLGALAGSAIDSALFGSSGQRVEGPRLADLTVTTSTYGAAIPLAFARASFALDLQGILLTAWVSAADTVSVRFQNGTASAIDLGSGTIRTRIARG